LTGALLAAAIGIIVAPALVTPLVRALALTRSASTA